MKVLTTAGLTKLIQLIKSAFISVNDTEQTSEVSLATVATTGAYSDLTGQPTIPVVYNSTITFTQGGTTKGTITLNQSNNATITLDAGGGSTPSNMVTTDTAQDISGTKTFVGEKRIKFKQSSSADKLGFTLYTSGNAELGALEWRPNTINGNALLALNCPQSGTNYVGFRYWGNINIVAPRPTTNGSYFITIGVTDGTNTVYTQTDTGVINISTLLSGKQDTLVSGTNIKTINNISLLGSGNIDIQGGGGSYTAGTGIDITNNVISADIATSVSSASTNSQSVSAKLFYDTVGNIESALYAINSGTNNKGLSWYGDTGAQPYQYYIKVNNTTVIQTGNTMPTSETQIGEYPTGSEVEVYLNYEPPLPPGTTYKLYINGSVVWTSASSSSVTHTFTLTEDTSIRITQETSGSGGKK